MFFLPIVGGYGDNRRTADLTRLHGNIVSRSPLVLRRQGSTDLVLRGQSADVIGEGLESARAYLDLVGIAATI